MRGRLKQFKKLETIEKNPKQLKTEAEMSKIGTKQSIQNFQATFVKLFLLDSSRNACFRNRVLIKLFLQIHNGSSSTFSWGQNTWINFLRRPSYNIWDPCVTETYQTTIIQYNTIDEQRPLKNAKQNTIILTSGASEMIEFSSLKL